MRAVIVLLLGVGCGGNPQPVVPDPQTVLLAPGIVITRSLPASSRDYYEVTESSGDVCVELGAPPAGVALSVFSDRSFVHALCQGTASATRSDCLLRATAPPLYVEVAATPAATYTLGVLPLAAAPYAPEGGLQAPAALGAVQAGQVGTRSTSYYAASVSAGQHVIDLRCLTGAADLHVYADTLYGLELDCTLRANPGATTCTVTGPGTVGVSVSAGSLNRDGAAYLIGVR